MEQPLFAKLLAWVANPEVRWTLVGVAAPLLFTPVFLWYARRSRGWASLDSVNFFLFDQNKSFVHIIGPHTYMPDDSPTVSVYHHRLFDRNTGKFFQGGEQAGDGIELDSGFLQRTTATLEAYLKQKLSLAGEKAFSFHSESDKQDGAPLCIERPWFESDTTKPKPPPEFGVIFRQYDGDRDKFRIEIFAHQKLLATHVIRGSCSSFKGLYDRDRQELLFVCSLGAFYRIGLTLLDMKNGALKFSKLVKPDIRAV